MRPVVIDRQLALADPNGIFLDQTTVGAADLTLNGALVVSGVAILDVQRQVELESIANLSAINFTITGTDGQGRAISETIAGPNAGVSATSLDFLTVTQIAVDGAVGTNVEGGTNASGGSVPVPIDRHLTPTNIGLGLDLVSGAATVDVQHTFDDIFTDDPSTLHTWFTHDTLGAQSADADGNLAFPPSAVRLLTTAGVGRMKLTIVQAGAGAS